MQNVTTLSNGLKVITEYADTVRSASVAVIIGVGSANEASETNGACHFIEHLMFKGTASRTAHAIAQAIEDYGGSINAFTEKEFTCFYAKVLTEQVPTTLDIFCDMLINSLLDPAEFELERQVILEEIKMYEDTPDELVYDHIFKALWGEHPLAMPVTGTFESVSNIDRDFIAEFVRSYYKPENITISIAGNFNEAQVIDCIDSHFANIHNLPSQATLPPVFSQPHKRFQWKDIEQAHMCIAANSVTITDKLRYPLALIDICLAGGISSRLFQEIRERRGLVYSINSFKALYKQAGLFGVYAGTNSANVDQVISLVMEEFDTIKNSCLTENEIIRSKKQLKGSLLLGLESMYYRAYRNAHSHLYFNRIYPIDEIIALIDDITCEDIQEVAGLIFRPDNYAISIVGPKTTPDRVSFELECVK